MSILTYDFPSHKTFDSITFKPSIELLYPYTLPESLNVDILWQAARVFSSNSDNPRPNWSGFMQDSSIGLHPPKATITLLPIIDLQQSDYNCIYSTLMFVISQSKKLNIVTPLFDQPKL